MKKSIYFLVTFILLFCIFVSLILNFSSVSSSKNLREDFLEFNSRKCDWNDKSPTIFYLNSKSGVNYEGGHWFHIAENFLVLHSILRSQGRLSNSTVLVLSADRSNILLNLKFNIFVFCIF